MDDSLLIIDGKQQFADRLASYFNKRDWEVEQVTDLRSARQKLLEEGFEPLVTLSDINLADGNSLDLLEQLRERGFSGEWVLLTEDGNVPDSVRALRLGAYDFLERPCSTERLSAILNGARRSAAAHRQLTDQREAGNRRYTPDAFLGRSEEAQQLRRFLSRLVEVPFSALVISGETGTGKGLVARIMHHSGPRAQGPLIEVNCAALPRDLLESELFGHEAGAFTGARGRHRGYMEQADGGTLFLDEIGEMDLDLQSKLLKVIEDRHLIRLGGEKPIRIDVQVIAASNLDLEERVRKGEFRDDLYHRLSVFKVELPALRDRIEDIEDLVPVMIAEFNAMAGRQVKVVPSAVYKKLRAYAWPGNVRELRNVVERAVLLSDGNQFPERWLQLDNELQADSQGPHLEGNRLVIPLDGSMALDEMDSYIIQTALQQHHHNVTAAARALGTTRETLRYRIQKYGLNTGEDMADQRQAGGAEVQTKTAGT